MRSFDKVFLEFPLCALSYPSNNKIEMIIDYCIVENSRKIKLLDKRIFQKKNEEDLPEDFDIENTWDVLITQSSIELRIKIDSIQKIRNNHSELREYVLKLESRFGDDAFCRMGKALLIQTRNKQFEYRKFAVLCAISSVLGKRTNFKRITKDRIAYRMLGYKSLEVYEKANHGEPLLTRRQIERVVKLLHAKGFFGKFTYCKRITYYSTKLNDEELRKAVLKTKIYWEERKNNLEDQEFSLIIKAQLQNLRKQKMIARVHNSSLMVH